MARTNVAGLVPTRCACLRHPCRLPTPLQGRGIERWSSSSSRIMASSKVTASRRFAQPLASEGHGSVFPVELPLSKRRAFEVEIMKRFDRRVFRPSLGLLEYPCPWEHVVGLSVFGKSEFELFFVDSGIWVEALPGKNGHDCCIDVFLVSVGNQRVCCCVLG